MPFTKKKVTLDHYGTSMIATADIQEEKLDLLSQQIQVMGELRKTFSSSPSNKKQVTSSTGPPSQRRKA